MTSNDPTKEGPAQPMSAEPVTAPPGAPADQGEHRPADPATLPVPPPPTREEELERERRRRADLDRLEHERASSSAARQAAAEQGVREAVERLIASERERQAIPPEQRPVGIPGVDYLIVDQTAERAAAARKAWERDLDVVRNLNAEDESLTRWTIADIEDPMARDTVEFFVQQIPGGKKRQLIITGSVGAGKTATGIAVGHACVDRGIRTRYVSHGQYLEHLRPEGNPPGGLRKDEYRKAMVEAPVLVLDDFCADMNTDVAASEFARRETIRLLNDRMAQGKTTIVTTNVTTAQVRVMMDDRIASRLGTNAIVVTMVEKDRRQPEVW